MEQEMLDQEIAAIGHNGAPDPIDEAVAPWSVDIEEANNWLDGEPIKTDGQVEAVDKLIKTMRTAGTKIGDARKATTDPLNHIYQAEMARWKPTTDDIERLKKGLVNLVAPIKKAKADEEARVKRVAWETARRAEADAAAARQAAQAETTNIDAQREADAVERDAKEARKAAQQASKSDLKGMRTVYKHEVTSGQDVIDWIIKNDRPALQRFIGDYVASHSAKGQIKGVRAWSEKEAY
jgi:hypothetical protein